MVKQIPEGPKGEGLRKLKAEAPEVVARMGYNKGGAVINKPKKPLKEIKSLGSFKVKINLHAEVQAEITIKVISQDNIK